MPLRQSEHLTFFSTTGLRNLAERTGFEVLFVGEYEMPTALTQSGRIAFSRVLRMLAIVAPEMRATRVRREDQ